MEHHCGGPGTNNHTSCSKRHRLKLYRVHIDEFDARVGIRGIADLDNSDGSSVVGGWGFHDFLAFAEFR